MPIVWRGLAELYPEMTEAPADYARILQFFDS
jgi:hypothetical protein